MTAKWQYKHAHEAAIEEARRLRDENERLRHESDFMRKSSVDWCNLAKKMHDLIIDMSPEVFEVCEMCGANGVYDVRECSDETCRTKWFHDRMREVGIEVG